MKSRVVNIGTHLDERNVQEVRYEVQQLVEEGVDVLVLDLGSVTEMDCAGLRLVLDTMGRQRAEGKRVLVTDLQPEVMRLLATSGNLSLLHPAEEGSAHAGLGGLHELRRDEDQDRLA